MRIYVVKGLAMQAMSLLATSTTKWISDAYICEIGIVTFPVVGVYLLFAYNRKSSQIKNKPRNWQSKSTP